ncbi:MAG TPA: ATP-binding protein [Thermoanaerobaculia bacterium]|nr:ATP-binding protein [Thermoanaerobaculia bacterium]
MSTLVEALLQTVGDPLWVVSPELTVTRFNAPFAALRNQGFDPRDAWWLDLARRALAGRDVSADARIVADGVERTFRVTGTPAGSDGAVFLARDVTDVSRGEREDRLELAVTRIFAADTTLQEALDDVLEFICESDEWDCAVIWLVDAKGTTLDPIAVWSKRGVNATKFHRRVRELRFARGRGIPGRAWLRDEVVWVADLLDETGIMRGEAAASAGLHGAVAVPLRETDRVVGVLEVFARTVRPTSEQRRRALSRAGASLGYLIVRRQLQELIERKGQEWTLTFDAIELPVFITRLDGTIARVNRAAREFAGANAFLDLLGRPIRLAEREPWITLGDVVTAVRDSRTPCTAQVSIVDAHWDLTASWYRSASDEEERVIVAMRDTTEVTRLQESVRRGEQLAALGELVAGVAHEVRNPIFGMGLTVDALQEMLSAASPEVMELFGILRAWLDRLNRLMENLLEYGKTWTLDLREGTIDSVVQSVLDGCRQIAAKSSVSIDAEVAPSLPMLMDSTRLSHAFENLIHNAIQHSRPGQTVTLRVRACDASTIECEVRDEGPGFDPIDLPRIFQPFFTRRRGGTGLGLSIVQRIVDEHGGTVAAANERNGGAILTMRFPVYRRSSHAE